MMPDRLVLDTDIVIHLLKKQPQTVVRFIELLVEQIIFLLSPIVVAEIYAGAFQRERKEIKTRFGLCKRISIDSETGQQAGHYAHRYRKAHQAYPLRLPAGLQRKAEPLPLVGEQPQALSNGRYCPVRFAGLIALYKADLLPRSSLSPSRSGSPFCLSKKVILMCWMARFTTRVGMNR